MSCFVVLIAGKGGAVFPEGTLIKKKRKFSSYISGRDTRNSEDVSNNGGPKKQKGCYINSRDVSHIRDANDSS
jgi:hypothetical protein